MTGKNRKKKRGRNECKRRENREDTLSLVGCYAHAILTDIHIPVLLPTRSSDLHEKCSLPGDLTVVKKKT